MDELVKVLKAVSECHRLRVVMVLSKYPELCACQIIDLLGLSGASVSRHLSILVSSGWLKNRRQCRWIYFSLNTDSPFITEGLQFLTEQSNSFPQIQSDLEQLKKMKADNHCGYCQSKQEEQ